MKCPCRIVTFVILALFAFAPSCKSYDMKTIIGSSGMTFTTNDSIIDQPFTSIFSDWNGTQMFSGDLWINRNLYYENLWYYSLRITNDHSQNLGTARAMMIGVDPDPSYLNYYPYFVATTSYDDGGVYFPGFNWETTFPQGVWTYFFYSSDSTTNQLFGYIMYVDPTTNTKMEFIQKNFEGTGTLYSLTSSAHIVYGGENNPPNDWYTNCNCTIQNMNFYRDLFVNDISMMNSFSGYSSGKLFIFNFLPSFPQSQTLAVDEIFANKSPNATNQATLGFSTAVESVDPSFGPYYLSCDSSNIATYNLGFSLTNAVSFNFWFQPSSGGTQNAVQTIVAISTGGSDWNFLIEYIPASLALRLQQAPSTSVTTAHNSIKPGHWNHIVVNCYYLNEITLDLYINNITTPTSYTTIAVPPTAIAWIYICAQSNGAGGTINGASIDIANFQLLTDAGVITAESSTAECALWFGFTTNIQTCAICNPGYAYYQRDCVSTCTQTTGLFKVTDSDTCQQCNYPYAESPTPDQCLNPTVLPAVIVNGPTSISACVSSGANINVTTSTTTPVTGAPFSYSWTVQSNLSNTTDESRVMAYFNNPANQTAVAIAANTLLGNASYSFSVTITNIFGYSSSSQIIYVATQLGNFTAGCSGCINNLTLINGSCVIPPPTPSIINNTSNSSNSSRSGSFGNSSGATPSNGTTSSSGSTSSNGTTSPTSTSSFNIAGLVMKSLVASSLAIPVLDQGACSSAIVLVQFFQDIQFYQLINIVFPDNFIQFCLLLNGNLIPNFISDLRGSDVLAYSQIGKFQTFSYNTNFLDNSGSNLNSEIISLGIIALSAFLAFVLSKANKIAGFFRKIRNLFMWNSFISYCVEDFPQCLLSALIQFREGSLDDAYSKASFAVSVLLLIGYAILIMILLYLINIKVKRENKRNYSTVPLEGEPKTEHISETLSIITEGFSQKTRLTRNFLVLMMVRNAITITILFSLQSYGLVQAILYTLISWSFLFIVLVVLRPLLLNEDFTTLILGECFKCLMGSLAIVLGATNTAPESVGLSLIIIVCVTLGLSGIIALALMVAGIWKLCKNPKKSQKNTPLTVDNTIGATKILIPIERVENRRFDSTRLENNPNHRGLATEVGPQNSPNTAKKSHFKKKGVKAHRAFSDLEESSPPRNQRNELRKAHIPTNHKIRKNLQERESSYVESLD